MITLLGHLSFGRDSLPSWARPGPLYLLLGAPAARRFLAYLDPVDADAVRRGFHGPLPLHFPHHVPPLPGPIVISAHRVIGHAWGLRATRTQPGHPTP